MNGVALTAMRLCMQQRQKKQQDCYCANNISHSQEVVNGGLICFLGGSDCSELDRILVLSKLFHSQVSSQYSSWGVWEPFGEHDHIFLGTSIFTLLLSCFQTLQVPSTESENITPQIYMLFFLMSKCLV